MESEEGVPNGTRQQPTRQRRRKSFDSSVQEVRPRIALAPSLLLILSLSLTAQATSQPPDQNATLQRLAFGSCSNQDKDQPILDQVLKFDPDVFVYLGDNIYGDTEDMTVLQNKYSQLADKPEFQRLVKGTRVLATWDDHDYGKNDAGREYPKKKESKQIFLDFWKEPPKSKRRKREGIYQSYSFGPRDQRVQIILLDLRTFRSPPSGRERTREQKDAFVGPYIPDSSPDATMLGDHQWKWLKRQLRRPAKIRVIGMSTQFLPQGGGWELWANFPLERQRLLDLIRKTKAQGVIFISGDTHWAELSHQQTDGLYPLYDLTSSGLTEIWDGVAPNQNRVGDPYLGANFGTLTVDWSLPDPLIQLGIRDLEGGEKLALALRLSELSWSSRTKR